MKIGIIGCAGRMGRTLIQQVLDTEGAELAAGTVRSDEDALGKDLGELVGREALGIKAGDDAEALFKICDAAIDFTVPENSLANARLAAKHGKVLVCGTTGFTDAQRDELKEIAKGATIIWAANMSVGVNLLQALVKKVASVLDEDYDIEVVEMHHRHKVDSPSGTALMLGEAAAEGRAKPLNEVACKARDGIIGARPKGEIGFATLRGGDVVGDHTVMFAADGERIELTHKASNRSVFAKGAVRAALWSKGQKKGLFNMHDVLATSHW